MKRIITVTLLIAILGVYAGVSFAETAITKPAVSAAQAQKAKKSKLELRAMLLDIAKRREHTLVFYQTQTGNIADRINTIKLEMAREELKASAPVLSPSHPGLGPTGDVSPSTPLFRSPVTGPAVTGVPSTISAPETSSSSGVDSSSGGSQTRIEELKTEIVALENQLAQLTENVQMQLQDLQTQLDLIEPTTDEERQLIAAESSQIQATQTFIQQEISTGISLPLIPTAPNRTGSEVASVAVTPSDTRLITGLAASQPPTSITLTNSTPGNSTLNTSPETTSFDGTNTGGKPTGGWWASIVSLISGDNKKPDDVAVGGFLGNGNVNVNGTAIGGNLGNQNPNGIMGNLGQGNQQPFNWPGGINDPVIMALLGSGGGAGGNPHDYSPIPYANPMFTA